GAIALLLHGTGGPGSPLVALALALSLQGGLLVGGPGALAGGGVAAALVYGLPIFSRQGLSAPLADLAALPLGCWLGAAYLWRRAHALLGAAREGLDRHCHNDRELDHAQKALYWHHLNLRVAECATTEALVRLTTSHATAIAGAAASVALASQRVAHSS